MRFLRLGNRDGIVGIGFGSANEIPSAISKSIADAKKNLIRVPLTGSTIPHEILGQFKAAKVLLKPASPGTGIIAGLATRIILDFAGVQDILTKRLGSRNAKKYCGSNHASAKSLKGYRQSNAPSR